MKIKLCATCAEEAKDSYALIYTGNSGSGKCGHCGKRAYTLQYELVKLPKSCRYLRDGRCLLGGGCIGERCEAYRGHEEV